MNQAITLSMLKGQTPCLINWRSVKSKTCRFLALKTQRHHGFTNTGKDLFSRRQAKIVAGIHVNKRRDMEDFLRLRINYLGSAARQLKHMVMPLPKGVTDLAIMANN